MRYADYLCLEELLSLQKPRSDPEEHDELLFITVHQVYELWFKLLLQELDHLATSLVLDDIPAIQATMKRVLSVLKTMVAQVDVVETLTPIGFLSFRDRLETASGFQSAQFRELEILMGHKRRHVLEAFAKGSDERQRLEERYAAPTLWDAFLKFLAGFGYPIPEDALSRDPEDPITPNHDLQLVLAEIYKTDPSCQVVCELLVDLDEGVQEWRYRHLKMVERTIGDKTGTGGSTGASYLKNTIRPAFEDLWAMRSEL